MAALLHDPESPQASARPAPVTTELRATLSGKTVAMRQLVERVALTDGAEALQQQLVSHLPQHTLVLDIIHATAYLWDTANALLGDTHPHRTTWVRHDRESLMAGPSDAVITALTAEANDPLWTATQRQTIRRTAGYYRRNRPYRRDDDYLPRGWPIGTGVIEGACRHLVKDRLEPSGMRWTKAGAQAILDLRAVRLNEHGDHYGQFHRQQQHHRLYGSSAPVPEGVESQALQSAA